MLNISLSERGLVVMGEKQIEVLVTLGAGGRSMGWSMAMSGGVFLLGKSQKRHLFIRDP